MRKAVAKDGHGETVSGMVIIGLQAVCSTFESDASLARALRDSGFKWEILERQVIWYFFCPRGLGAIIDFAWKYLGDTLFEWLDRITRSLWRRESGYYLVIRKHSNS